MKSLRLLFALVLLPGPVLAASVLATLGDITITSEDFEAELLRAPPESRSELRADPQRVARVVENILVTRVLAIRARSNGIDQESLAAREVQVAGEKILARRERERLEQAVQTPDFSKRAEEIYKTRGDRYSAPPTYRTQHILVSTRCRTADEARARATQARKEILEGLAFEEAVARYSEDPSAPKNKGDIGFMPIEKVAAEYGESMQKLKRGEISSPVLTQFGWHVIKLIDSTPRVPYRYEQVRESILAELRDQYVRAKIDENVAKIRSDPAIKINPEALDALVASIPPGATANPAIAR